LIWSADYAIDCKARAQRRLAARQRARGGPGRADSPVTAVGVRVAMERTLVIKGKAGLGNRILATLTGMAFGRLCRRRILVDWTDGAFAAPGVNAFQRLFASPVVEAGDLNPRSTSVAPRAWRGQIDQQVADMIARYDPKRFSDPTIYRKYCCDLSTLNHPEDVIVYWSYLPKFQRIRRHFRDEFSVYRNSSEQVIIKNLMAKLMPLRDEISDAVREFAETQFRPPMIAVHVRYSDMRSPIKTIHRAIERFRAEQPAAGIFLATDNRAIEDAFRSRYPHVVVTPKWLPSPGEQVHYNTANLDPQASAIEALKDIYLLSRADYLVYPGRSTFSYLARCLGDFPERRVCDVEKYDLGVRARRFAHNLV
jgi:Nodulation protein Z (NodZ)